MKVTILDKECNEYGEGAAYTVKTPQSEISIGDMEPEDATLNRDLSCVFSISDMILEAYNAGKNGEELIFEHIEEEE